MRLHFLRAGCTDLLFPRPCVAERAEAGSLGLVLIPGEVADRLRFGRLPEFLSPEENAARPLEDLIDFLMEKGNKHFSDPKATAEALKKVTTFTPCTYYYICCILGTRGTMFVGLTHD